MDEGGRRQAPAGLLRVKPQRREIQSELHQIRQLAVVQQDGRRFEEGAGGGHEILRHDGVLEAANEVDDAEHSGAR